MAAFRPTRLNDQGLLDEPQAYPAPGWGERPRFGDVDGDGNLDVVVGSAGAVLATYLGDGSGSLGAAQTDEIVADASDLELADFDQDGMLDALYGRGLPGVGISWGDGDGGFGFTQMLTDLDTNADGVSVIDVDVDGRLDVAAITRFPNELVVWRNAGARQFDEPFAQGAGLSTQGLVAADVDGDGRADLLTEGAGLWLARSDGLGGFLEMERYVGPGNSYDILAADWDTDGRMDLLFGRNGADNVTLLKNVVGDPEGTERYGSGTPGCEGAHGLAAALSVEVGGTLRVTCTQSPPQSVGLLLLGAHPDFAGSDVFGLGLVLHLDVSAGGFTWRRASTASAVSGWCAASSASTVCARSRSTRRARS